MDFIKDNTIIVIILILGIILLLGILFSKKSKFGATATKDSPYKDPTGTLNDEQKLVFNTYLTTDPNKEIEAFMSDNVKDTNTKVKIPITYTESLAIPKDDPIARTTAIINCLGTYTSLYSSITKKLTTIKIDKINNLSALPPTLDAPTKHAIWTLLLNRESVIISKLDPNIIETL